MAKMAKIECTNNKHMKIKRRKNFPIYGMRQAGWLRFGKVPKTFRKRNILVSTSALLWTSTG